MSEYIGSRISLISKSDIRYVGTLHQINSEQSTVSLENVRSFGTEGRKGKPEEEIGPSDQVYEYIIFRGSDVKDLRIEQQPVKETKPSSVPTDPAILGARPRPDASQGPNTQAPAPNGPGGPGPSGPGGPGFPQPGHPQPPFNNNFYGPPPPGSWGRGAGPGAGPGPGFGNMPYPPPPGWYPPPQGFQPGPGGPGPWNPNFPYPPNLPNAPMPPNQDQSQKSRATPEAEAKQGPSGPSSGPKQAGPAQPSQPQPPTEPKSLSQGGPKPQAAVEAKPAQPAAEKTAAQPSSQKGASRGPEAVPTGPKNNRVAPVIPALPKPFPVPTSISAGVATTSKAPSGGGIQDATEAAKAAVALAMAKMETGNNAAQTQNGPTMDNLTKRVDEMRVNAARAGNSGRGRGRGGRGGTSKVEVPNVDFDFAESNAKFNKEDLVREAISAASPVGESAILSNDEAADMEIIDKPADQQAYNRTRSFFDNISSEAKDRAAANGQRPGGREWRGQEQQKNMETFGQGSVDGGYRNYRGRGRGRGGPRGRGYQNRGGAGGYRGRGAPASTSPAGQ